MNKDADLLPYEIDDYDTPPRYTLKQTKGKIAIVENY
jgi:hypothetical protein